MVSFDMDYVLSPIKSEEEKSDCCNTSGESTTLSAPSASGDDAVESPPSKTSCQRASRTNRGEYEKPPYSYIALISMAILHSKERKLLLGDIYQFIMTKFPFYKYCSDKAWRNSIRHNLSLNECFIKNGRADNGKGNFWSVHPACVEDFKRGDFRRRQARRRARRSQNTPGISQIPLQYRYNMGYVPMTSMPAAMGVAYRPFGTYNPGTLVSSPPVNAPTPLATYPGTSLLLSPPVNSDAAPPPPGGAAVYGQNVMHGGTHFSMALQNTFSHNLGTSTFPTSWASPLTHYGIRDVNAVRSAVAGLSSLSQ